MENKLTQNEKNLILARLDAVDPGLCFASGVGGRSYTKDELMNEIESQTAVGISYAKTQLEFLRAFKDGSLMNIITTA